MTRVGVIQSNIYRQAGKIFATNFEIRVSVRRFFSRLGSIRMTQAGVILRRNDEGSSPIQLDFCFNLENGPMIFLFFNLLEYWNIKSS